MKPLGSVAAVVAAIREDASAEAEALDRQAQTEIDRIRTSEASDVVTIPDRERKLAAARQHARVRLAHEDWEDTREAVADRDRWLARAAEIGEQQLAGPEDPLVRRERLTALAHEALARLPGHACEIVVSGATLPLLDFDWCRAVATATGREEVRVVEGPVDGGCVVRTLDGRASFDNTFAARGRRFQATWRAALAELHEQALRMASSPADRLPGV
jgi:vacuolar-type H+-ATPase subunit E/Vma4